MSAEYSPISISTAESLTCGMIASEIGNHSGVSKWFKGGVVTYSNESKINLLKTEPKETHKENGVSENIAKMMAKGVAELMGTDIGISSTGYAEKYTDKEGKDISPVAYISVYDKRNEIYIVDKCVLITDKDGKKSMIVTNGSGGYKYEHPNEITRNIFRSMIVKHIITVYLWIKLC